MYVKHGTLDRVDWGSTIMFLNVSYLNLIFYRTHCCITLRSHRARQYMFLNVSYLKVIWWNSLLNSACRDSIYMFFNKKTVGHLSKLTQWLHPNQLESNQMQWLKLWENIGGKGGGGAGEYVVMNRLHKRSIFPYSSSCKSTSIQGKSSLCEDLNLKEARSVAAPVFTHSLEQLDMISCTANSSFWTLINPDFPTRFHFYMHRQWSHGMGRTKFCMDKVESTCIWINQVKRQKS